MGVVSEAPKTFDIVAMLRTIIDGETDRGRSIRLEGLMHAPVRGKPVAIRRMLWNVIGNALKYGNAATVRVGLEGGQILVEVMDDGPGLPVEELERVFEPFYRVENSRSRQTGGTGLGLAICRRLTELMGGKIWVESDAGKGAAFELTLTLRPAAPAANHHHPSPANRHESANTYAPSQSPPHQSSPTDSPAR
jgi:signal transduction histidine kinase